jgi:S1-C subfamily serine protease
MIKSNLNYMTKIAITVFLIASIPAHATSLENLFKKVNPAVVLINTEETKATQNGNIHAINSRGLGSGVLISDDGKVLTAAHLIQASDFIEVEFLDGTKVSAEVVSSFIAADIALLQLNTLPENLSPVNLGDSDDVSEGSQVFVIGAPYGLSHTLTVGHISARHASNSIMNNMQFGEFLQTDAAINKGNSGGPLFNMNGEVVGIISQIISQSGGSEGLGFALTSNTAKKLVLEKPPFWSGLQGYRLPEKLAKILNVPQTTGVLVQKVAAYSPAARLGLISGDMTIEVNGEKVLLGGDIILEVNNIKIESKTSYKKIRRSIEHLVEKKENFSVKVLRGGDVINLSTYID